MSAESALDRLYSQSLSFSLYAEHAHGLSVPELALLTSRPESWISERIEAMRLCLEKQVVLCIEDPQRCPDQIWHEQVWD